MTATAGADGLRELVRDVPDFPKPGIVFKDITPVMASPDGYRAAVSGLVALAQPLAPQFVVAAEARGYLLGPAVAAGLGAGFVLARKPGKLPRETVSAAYQLEYGTDRLELHTDALRPASRVLVHDDLLATGGTAQALCGLVEQCGAEVVACNFLIELAFLGGRERLAPHEVHALLTYDDE
ncbi:MAG TPA: adenine phosphoribosyltransferase [Solirubrobacteraceae bacterium]